MIEEAVECGKRVRGDVLAGGVVGMTRAEMRQYLEYVADQRLTMLGTAVRYNARNPFSFMELQERPGAHQLLCERRVRHTRWGSGGDLF